jgi:Flp pilus assembly protein TadB
MSASSENNPHSAIPIPKPSLTDSPWFWVLAFSSMALLALAVLGYSGKYDRRQSNIEQKYQARDRTAAQLEKDLAANNLGASPRIDEPDAHRPYSTPGNELIPIWPLGILLGLIAVVAARMLQREYVRQRTAPDSLPTESS